MNDLLNVILKHEKRAGGVFGKAILAAQRKVNADRLGKLSMFSAQREAMFALDDFEHDFEQVLIEELTKTVGEGWLIAVKGLAKPKFIAARRNREKIESVFGLNFNKTNPWVFDYIHTRAAGLVTEITQESRVAIRHIIAQGFAQSVNRPTPREMGKLIQKSIGLTSRDTQALWNARQRLLDSPGKLVVVGKKEYRVPEGGISRDRLTAILSRYSEQLSTRRGLLIARTEIVKAANDGQRLAWNEATRKKIITGTENREWIITGDERTCPICTTLEGQLAPINGLFNNRHLGPPAHPGCRCTTVLVFPRDFKPKPPPAPPKPPEPPPGPPVPPPAPPIPPPTPPPIAAPAPIPPLGGPRPEPVRHVPVPPSPPQSPYYVRKWEDDGKFTSAKQKQLLMNARQTVIDEMTRLRDQFGIRSNIDIVHFDNGKTSPIPKEPKSDALGWYRFNSDFSKTRNELHIAVNDNAMANVFSGKLEWGAWTVRGGKSNFESTLRHELGHHVDDLINRKGKGSVIATGDSFSDMMQASFKRAPDGSYPELAALTPTLEGPLSRYGSSNRWEVFAESFSAYTHPDYGKEGTRQLPKPIHDWFTQNLPRKK